MQGREVRQPRRLADLPLFWDFLRRFRFRQRAARIAKLENEIGGWLIFLALSLIGLPLAALVLGNPLFSLWREPLRLMNAWGVWDDAREALGHEFGGVFLLPLFTAVLPALAELAPLGSFVASSVVLLTLLWLRTREFPRAFLLCVVMQLACVLGGFYAIDLLANVTPALLNYLRGVADPGAADAAAWIRHHDDIARPTAISFAWIFLGYLV